MRDWRDLFVLTYEKPTKLDNAMAHADEQLHYALKCTSEARKTAKGNKVNPRSIDKEGNLVLVGPKDWCSGFLPVHSGRCINTVICNFGVRML